MFTRRMRYFSPCAFLYRFSLRKAPQNKKGGTINEVFKKEARGGQFYISQILYFDMRKNCRPMALCKHRAGLSGKGALL